MKTEYVDEARKIFSDSGINITSEGRKHLGAVIGSEEYKEEYVSGKIASWVDEMDKLSQIALTEPHAAYSAFVHGMRNKFTYTMRTIPNISNQLKALDQAIDKFIKSMLSNYDFNETERLLFSLPIKLGGLGISIPSKISDTQYINSVYITEPLTKHVIEQKKVLEIDEKEIKKRKNKAKIDKNENDSKTSSEVKSRLSEQQKRIIECVSEKGASNWLSALPLKKFDFHLEKQAFRDAIFLRYNINLPKLPLTCVCGTSFTVNHALSCMKGGFMIVRHNEVRDLTAELLEITCKDVEVEPVLTSLTGETFSKKTTNVANDARVDISARSFWNKGQKAYVDIRVFNPLARSYLKPTLASAYKKHEQEKKREYNERIINVEHATFTPIVFSSFGGMSYECDRFVKRLK